MRGLRRSLTARGRWFAGAGTLLLILGTVLGLRDLSRIGVLLLALTAGSLFLSRRHGLQLTVERELRPGRVTVDQPSTVTVHIRNPEGTRAAGSAGAGTAVDEDDRPAAGRPVLLSDHELAGAGSGHTR